jgi:uncharacterized membrane protein YdjX (TVP38/TMEM64 family)
VTSSSGRWDSLLKWLGLLAVGIAALVVLVSLGGEDGFGTLQADNPARTYFLVFFLVAMDAVIPVFPGETTLNAASTFAANGDLDLWLVIVVGALGAIVGDSSLYWIARRSSSRLTPQLEPARKNTRVASALDFLARGAPVLLVFGRYVPGLRFVINSTMGMNKVPVREVPALVRTRRGHVVHVHMCARLQGRVEPRQLSPRVRLYLRPDHDCPDGGHLLRRAPTRQAIGRKRMRRMT